MKLRYIVIQLAAFGLMLNASIAQETLFPQEKDPWYEGGAALLQKRLAMRPIDTPAKNVILMIGDGMGPNTVFAARLFEGQSRGKSGEEHVLAFERFPHVAYAKTYTTNAQTPDSAGTASAMMTGIKTKSGVIGVTEKAMRGSCTDALAYKVMTLGELAERAGMSTGVVTTARLTHATPAAFYAHSANRNWENDSDLPKRARGRCKDIAAQLIDFAFGDGIDVAMGGGRRSFTTKNDADPENNRKTGKRKDGRNLLNEWMRKSNAHIVVQNLNEFNRIDINSDPKVLGVFDRGHMTYEVDRANDTGGEPSLAQMTQKAIEILSKSDKGYVLMVEGGRIDHASHAGNAYRTLTEAQAFNKAVATAVKMTDVKDTLIIATADHGHTLNLQGYAQRGNPILGLLKGINKDGSFNSEPALAADGKPYTVITFGNGPGALFKKDGKHSQSWVQKLIDLPGAPFKKNGEYTERPDPAWIDTTDKNYRQQALVPKKSETHGPQDVGIYASGPKAHLIGGVVEQNYIFHVIEHALSLKTRAGLK